MRRPRLRITVRRLMVVVGIIALILGLRRQSAAYHRRAEDYAVITFHTGSRVLIDGEFVGRDPVSRVVDPWAWKMAGKYWHLADYPWLPVGSDPPPPPEALPQLTKTLEPYRSHLGDWTLRQTSPPTWTLLWSWH